MFLSLFYTLYWNIDWQMKLDAPQPPMKMWDLCYLEDDALVDKACSPRILKLHSIDWNTWNHTTYSKMESNLWKMSCSSLNRCCFLEPIAFLLHRLHRSESKTWHRDVRTIELYQNTAGEYFKHVICTVIRTVTFNILYSQFTYKH